MKPVSFKTYLCGSRWFGDATEDSDYDFFADYSEANERELVAGRWTESEGNDYADNNTIVIYKKDNYHMSLVISVDRRLNARQLARYFPKEQRKDVQFWNKLYALPLDAMTL